MGSGGLSEFRDIFGNLKFILNFGILHKILGSIWNLGIYLGIWGSFWILRFPMGFRGLINMGFWDLIRNFGFI